MRKIGMITLLLWGCATSATVFATEHSYTINDPKQTYTVGFLQFTAASLALEYEYLLASIPRLLIDELDAIKEHVFTAEEIDAYKAQLKAAEIQTVDRRIDTLVTSRDALLFSGGTNAQTDNEIATAIDLKNEIMAIPLQEIAIDTTKPLQITNLATENNRAIQSLNKIASDMQIDLIIRGHLVQQDEFFNITIQYYYAAEKNIYIFDQFSFAQDELSSIPIQIAEEIAILIAGQQWGLIEISGVDKNDAVYVNDELVGFGDQELKFQPIGEYTVTVESVARDDTLEQIVQVAPMETVSVAFSVDAIEFEDISITTNPTGASVYINSTWQGITPLTIPKPLSTSTVLIRKTGYFDAKLSLDSESNSVTEIMLFPEIFDESEWLFSRRDTFYDALTAFIISVPIPIIFSGLYDNLENYQSTTSFFSLSSTEQANIINSANIMFIGQYAGIVISAVLLLNTIVEIVNYVDAADLFHRL